MTHDLHMEIPLWLTMTCVFEVDVYFNFGSFFSVPQVCGVAQNSQLERATLACGVGHNSHRLISYHCPLAPFGPMTCSFVFLAT